MGQGRLGIVADILPPVDRRAKHFTRDVVGSAIAMGRTDIIDVARKHGLIVEMECTSENREHWQHLPVNEGDKIFQFVEGLE